MSVSLLLESILAKQKEQYPQISEDDFFEIYCANNILINHDLSAEELDRGIVDGSKDGGIDSVFAFVNRQVLAEDFDYSNIKQPVEIELFVIQSKNQDSFKEGPIDKLASSLPMLLDENQTAETLEGIFKTEVISVFQSFISAMRSLAGEFPNISINIFYCCKGSGPNDTMVAKSNNLVSTLNEKYPSVDFEFLGSDALYNRSSKQKRLVKMLPLVNSPLSGANSYVALCTLKSYIGFISDDDDSVLTRIFEANVRAYQGEVEVNKEIAASLKNPTDGVDFWWLNNGVTVVADAAQFNSNQLVIENPLIVNGLQTSHELYKYAADLPDDDQRLVLVRVIVETDREKRDEIIRATNRQTNIKHSSFRATEPIHKEIEDYLLTQGYFYDRRKNYHKREGKPADKIISIDRLAQGVLALLQQQPHVARARPTTAIKAEKDYAKIFSTDKDTHPLELYGITARLMWEIDSYFRKIATPENQVYRNNLKFHVLMVLGWTLNKNRTLPAQRIRQLNLGSLDEALISTVVDWVFEQFGDAGPEDRTAKDSGFTGWLQNNWILA